jgi:signal transduction histidine kinase
LFARKYGFDVLVVIAALEGALEVALRKYSVREPGTAPWFAVPAMTLVVLPLLARRRFPFAAPLVVWLLATTISLVDGRLVTSIGSSTAAGMAAAILLGNLRDASRRLLGLAAVVAGAVIVIYNGPNHAAGDFIFTPLFFAIGWISGFALRQRSSQVEAAEERATHAEWEREAVARIVVAEERSRIARELHDIVAHAVSVMVLQVGAVRHKLPQTLHDEHAALKSVEHAGRTALTEMRRLLGAMRDDDEELALTPQPGLGGLDSLLDEVGRAGLPVRLKVDGEPFPLPAAIDLAAYRIIQEGLTNTLKHAHASHADLLVRYGTDELAIEVHDDGNGKSASDGMGHGLIGVRERVNIHGGTMKAGTATDGGFLLATSLPLKGYGR